MTNPHAGDCRRATALVCHYGNQNLDGVNEILKEAVAVNRVTPLITSVLDLHGSMGPLLHTQDGLACLTQMIYSLAEKRTATKTAAAPPASSSATTAATHPESTLC